MKQLYLDIIAKLRAGLTTTAVPHIDVWNDQVNSIEQQKIYSFATPAVFVELFNTNDIQRLGGGYTIYNNLRVRIHVVDQKLDAGDGTQERNLTVFDLKQTVFSVLDNYEPDRAGMFHRGSEDEDKSHTNIYHFMQEYMTNLVDTFRKLPIDGVTKAPPTVLELTKTIVDEII